MDVVPPTGIVTFLFTDIEGSTQLWEEHREKMSGALAEHDRIIRQAIDSQGGQVFSTGGDGVAAAFEGAAEGLAAALGAQRACRPLTSRYRCRSAWPYTQGPSRAATATTLGRRSTEPPA